MATGIYLNESVWNSPLVGYNKKSKTGGSLTYVRRIATGSCYQKLGSFYQITARPRHLEEEEKK